MKDGVVLRGAANQEGEEGEGLGEGHLRDSFVVILHVVKGNTVFL